MNLGPTEMMIILVIMLLLFGGSQLPKLARSIGQAQKEFKDAMD
ncbi:MAG: twin-arginine translocase TatA/TatE family subunit [Acidimicrobiales bacterium]|nr:twin-arginine translocase TatA/TatE family subunit [Acidimicrobiales bacterium]